MYFLHTKGLQYRLGKALQRISSSAWLLWVIILTVMMCQSDVTLWIKNFDFVQKYDFIKEMTLNSFDLKMVAFLFSCLWYLIDHCFFKFAYWLVQATAEISKFTGRWSIINNWTRELSSLKKVIVFVLKVLALITCFSIFDVDGTLDLS